jgi:hypothetical protein
MATHNHAATSHRGADRHGAEPLNRLARSATVHCLTGCAIGEVEADSGKRPDLMSSPEHKAAQGEL